MIGLRDCPALLTRPAESVRCRATWLVVAGATSALAYALLILWPLRLDRHPPSRSFSLAHALGEDRAGVVRFVATVALLFALYLWGLVAVKRAGSRSAALALGFGVLFCLVLLPAHPFHSYDVFHYVATSREWYLHGYNPLVIAPQAVPGDPLSVLPDWGELPSPYGPVWTYVTAAPELLVRGSDSAAHNVVAFKALAVAWGIAAVWLAGAIAERLRPGARAATIVLLAWNPLFVMHVAGDGHNDTVMLCLLLLAVYLALRGRVLAAGAALALSVLVKFASGMFAPLLLMWLWRSGLPRRRRDALLIVVMFPLLAYVSYLPFWEGWRTFDAARNEGGYLTTSPLAAVVPALETRLSQSDAENVLVVGARLAFLPVLLLAARRGRNDEELIATGALVFLLYLTLAAPWFMPWYALWPLSLAAAVPWRRLVAPVVALTFGASLLPVANNYLSVMSGDGVDWRALNLSGALLVFAPVCLTLMWMRFAANLREPAQAVLRQIHRVGGEQTWDGYDTVRPIAGHGRTADDDHAGSADRPGSGGALYRAGAGTGQGVHGEPRQAELGAAGLDPGS